MSVSVASAASYTVSDVEYFYDDVSLIEAGETVSWTHNYSFDPALDYITDASLTLSISDSDEDRWWNWCSYEIAMLWTEAGFIAAGEVDTADYALSVNSWMLRDGSYTVYLTSLWGDFNLNSSTLSIDYVSTVGTPAPVPEPATMVLLGIGLLGIAGVSRKKDLNR